MYAWLRGSLSAIFVLCNILHFDVSGNGSETINTRERHSQGRQEGAGANCPRASSSNGPDSTQCFKVWEASYSNFLTMKILCLLLTQGPFAPSLCPEASEFSRRLFSWYFGRERQCGRYRGDERKN